MKNPYFFIIPQIDKTTKFFILSKIAEKMYIEKFKYIGRGKKK